jgi:hypothetical protein
MCKQSDLAYEAIRKEIEKSTVAGADETGAHINGKLNWMWIFQNLVATYIFQHSSRGKAAIDERFPEGLPRSILVTDRHRSYFNMETAGHQICLAHLLRELIYLGEVDKEQKWSPAMLDLLRESIHQRKTIPFSEIDRGKIKERFDALITQDITSPDKKIQCLQKSLIEHREHLFLFLEYEDVPYENNASERAARQVKVKQKVSGMSKSEDGANAFSRLYSIADTARKNKQDPFRAFIAIAQNILNS